jgi:hypothetical protein
MSNYTPLKGYKVYIINSSSSGIGTEYNLHNTYPHTEPFPTHEGAENWIENYGDRQVTYTILEIFRKP